MGVSTYAQKIIDGVMAERDRLDLRVAELEGALNNLRVSMEGDLGFCLYCASEDWDSALPDAHIIHEHDCPFALLVQPNPSPGVQE
jgi:hypothetical protein